MLLCWKMRELQHENITTFRGFFIAAGLVLCVGALRQGNLEDLLRE